MIQRAVKRVMIILIYALIFSSLSYLIYLAVREQPTCTDNKENQNEEGVDCGGVCAPCKQEIVAKDIEVLNKDIVYGGEGLWDVLIEIKNPNNNFGRNGFRYTITLEDGSGNEIGSRVGEAYILPVETKYILETNFPSSVKPESVSVKIEGDNWMELEVFEEPELGVFNKQFFSRNDNGKSEVRGLIRNESEFDFNAIDVDIIIRDLSGKPMAVISSEMNTMAAQEERDFKIVWPYEVSGDVGEVEVKVETNVFDSLNFMKNFPATERFQEFDGSQNR